LVAALPAQAQEPLSFFENYFITGDYAVRGVSLWRQGVKGTATAQIPPLDVPARTDIVAAFLYIQTAESIDGSGIDSAALAGWMVFGKVFSPQYLTWLLPLAVVACVAGGRRSCWLLLIVLALTQAIYPFLYSVGVPDGDGPWFGLVVAARNAALLAWAVGMLRRDWARVAPGECPDLVSG